MFNSGLVLGQGSELPAPMPNEAATIDCYPGQPRNIEGSIPTNASSTNGAILTAKGNLKVLVIFAGYSEEAVSSCASYNAVEWPNNDPANPQMLEHTFPANLGSFFYTNANQFSLTATDQSFSNLFYQMSRTSSNPFRMTFGYLPTRINVAYSAYPDLQLATRAVVQQAVAQYPNFDWAAYDQRTN